MRFDERNFESDGITTENLPLVSVIIPVYNVQNYLKECLDSILEQTEGNIEVICVDDGSTDESFEILHHYEVVDPRVIVLQQSNQGGGVARNTGMKIARGRYLSFLDADDFFEPQMIEKASTALENTGADIVIYRSLTYDTLSGRRAEAEWIFNNEMLPPHQPFSYKDMQDYIFNAFGNVAWNKMFRRSFVESNNLRFQNIYRANDLLFVCSALVLAEKMVTIDEPLVHYRVNMTDNCQATNDKYPLAFFEAFFALKEFLKSQKLYDKVKTSHLNHAVDGVVYNLCSQKTFAGFSRIYDARNEIEKCFNALSCDTSLYRDSWQFGVYKDFCTMEKEEFLYSLFKKTEAQRNVVQENNRCLCEENARLAIELADVYNSLSYKTGSVLGMPVRKLREFARSH